MISYRTAFVLGSHLQIFIKYRFGIQIFSHIQVHMTDRVTLLTPATNYAVVQLPNRNFPGVVFQGDSLFALVSDLTTISSLMDGKEIEEASSELKFVIENLSDILSHYENTLSKLNISLPYVRSDRD